MTAKQVSEEFSDILGGMIQSGACRCDDESGSGLVGGRRRTKRAKPKFNIGKYNKAINQGHSKVRAKEIARGGGLIY